MDPYAESRTGDWSTEAQRPPSRSRSRGRRNSGVGATSGDRIRTPDTPSPAGSFALEFPSISPHESPGLSPASAPAGSPTWNIDHGYPWDLAPETNHTSASIIQYPVSQGARPFSTSTTPHSTSGNTLELPLESASDGVMSGDRRESNIKRRRGRAGCITCKKRRIKCDDAYPTCKNCVKSRLECISNPLFKRPENIVSGDQRESLVKRRRITNVACMLCRRLKIKCDGAHPTCKKCVETHRECIYGPIFKSDPSTAAIQPAPSSVKGGIDSERRHRGGANQRPFDTPTAIEHQISLPDPATFSVLTGSLRQGVDAEPDIRQSNLFRWSHTKVRISESSAAMTESGNVVRSKLASLVAEDRAGAEVAFEGHDIISIFSQTLSTAERFSAIRDWNDRIQVAMQRYHLPFIGKILSPGDSRLLLADIPLSPRAVSSLSMFLFQSPVFTPPTSGIAPSVVGGRTPVLQTLRSREATTSTTSTSSLIQINDILEYLDFPLVCTLISHWFGFGRCRTIFLPDVGTAPGAQEGIPRPLNPETLESQYASYRLKRQGYMDKNRSVVTAPYEVFPRRLWDLHVNRVIPFYLLQLPWNTEVPCFPEYVAISHSWVEAPELEYIYTSINQGAWLVPLPKGVDLELIRNEVLGHFPSSRYCWLDVLCLRQPSAKDCGPARHVTAQALLESLELGQDPTGERVWDEVAIDVPTIGNVYKNTAGVLRYFNGLGKPFNSTEWDNPHHWLNRAWTLQESTTRMMNGGLLDPWLNPLNTISIWRGNIGRLRGFLDGVEELGAGPRLNSRRSIIALAREMSRRRASKGVDKIAALSYLLHFKELPLYSQDEDAEQAWKRCLKSAPPTLLAELFFNCPFTGLFGLFPTWHELSDCPEALVKQEIPSALAIIGCHFRSEDSWFREQNMSMDFQFSGYNLSAYIRRTQQDGNSYLVVAQPKPESRYPGMSVNLRYFPPHGQSVMAGWPDFVDGSAIYQLFTHSLSPCSSWVVLREGRKVGVLCCDEVFGGVHRAQIIDKGSLLPSPDDIPDLCYGYKFEFVHRHQPSGT